MHTLKKRKRKVTDTELSKKTYVSGVNGKDRFCSIRTIYKIANCVIGDLKQKLNPILKYLHMTLTSKITT
jgi:hypothetical protein